MAFERVVVEDGGEFVERCALTGRFGSPIYYRDMLESWPELCAAGVRAVVLAQPGGVVLSCGRGCDRTGLVTFLLLGLVGVSADDIAEDWQRSVYRLRPSEDTYEAALTELLERERTTVLKSVTATLASFDIADRLRAGGLSDNELQSVSDRPLEPINL